MTVEKVKGDGSLVLRDGRSIPNHFRQFTHGYATSSHAAQGKTVDHGILILGEKGCRAANLKQAYVSNSRFRQSQTIFASDKDAAFDSMARDTERPLALETIKKDEAAKEHAQTKESQVAKMRQQPKGTALDWTPAVINPA